MAAAGGFSSSAQGWKNHLAGGWQIQGIFQAQSGPPIGFCNINFSGSSLADIVLPRNQRKPDLWFNTNAGFERDPARQLGSNIRAFPLRLTGLRADGINHWDLSAFKNFRARERVRLQFRAEAQEALNHAPFAAPNIAATNTLFGQVTSIQATEARRISVGLKLSF